MRRPVVLNLDKGVDHVIKMILELLKTKERVAVCVGGGSSSGKTSEVAKKIIEYFGLISVLLSADDYYRGIEFMMACWKRGDNINWDDPRAIYLSELAMDFEKLIFGTDIARRKYSFATGISGFDEKNPTIRSARVIVVEGLFVLNDELSNLADINVFVDIGNHGRLMRRLIRDVARAGQKRVEILRMFCQTVQPMHDEHVEPTKINADVIISNEYNPDIEAKKLGMFQRQTKFRAVSDEDFLFNLGAHRLSVVNQRDQYLTPLVGNFKGELMRIRSESGEFHFCYKGPKLDDGPTLVKPYVAFEIEESMLADFDGSYGQDIIIFKKRKWYILNGVAFSLDNVSAMIPISTDRQSMGNFIEVHGEPSEIEPVLQKLGLKMEDAVGESYFDLAHAQLEASK